MLTLKTQKGSRKQKNIGKRKGQDNNYFPEVLGTTKLENQKSSRTQQHQKHIETQRQKKRGLGDVKGPAKSLKNSVSSVFAFLNIVF